MLQQLVVDSVTSLGSDAQGAVVVTGSHAGIYSAHWLASVGVKAAILNDASVGLDNAGIAGLARLQAAGIPAAAVAASSARIGDGWDCLNRGTISHVNKLAEEAGCRPGHSCAAAIEHLGRSIAVRGSVPASAEVRHLVMPGPPQVWAADSAALVTSDDVDRIMLTGSHGGLLGGRAETAIRANVRAAVFNDAGIGMEAAGVTRLPALDDRGIAAATVSAWTARIGDGLSTYKDGVLSAVNKTAFERGARVGMPAKEFVDILLSLENGGA